MRNYIRIAAMFLVLVPAVTSYAGDDVTRFSGEFVRVTGKPDMEVRKFSGIAGPATLMLYDDGDQCSTCKRVSSSWVSVNGARVFFPSKPTFRTPE